MDSPSFCIADPTIGPDAQYVAGTMPISNYRLFSILALTNAQKLLAMSTAYWEFSPNGIG